MARPTDWDESKERHQIRLTPTCWRHLGDIAAANDLPSRAEAIEYLSRYAVKQSLVFEQDDISLEAIANLDAFATQLNCSRSEFVERLARGDGDAIALLVAQEINELVQRYEQAKICQQDITRYPTSVEFKLDKLNGFLLDKESLVVIDSWGAVEPDQIAQTQAWLKAEQKLRSLRAFINNKEPV